MSEAATVLPPPEPVAVTPQRLRVWSGVIGRFLGVQTLVQVLSFLVGLLVLRNLSKAEYALFTVANALQATMTMLADMGIEAALSSIGGRVWHDRPRFSGLIAAAMQARRTLVLVSVASISPVLFYVLRRVGATVPAAVSIVALVDVGVLLQVRLSILASVPRFLSQVSFIQRFDLLSALLRLLVFGLAALWALNCAGCVALNVALFGVGLLWMQRHCATMVDLSAPADPEHRREIFLSVRRLGANTVFYCFQGQIAVWLISTFGNASATAEVGALGRIGIIYTIVGSLMVSVLLPSFAKTPDFRGSLHKYFLIFGGFLGIGAALTGMAWLFPETILWVLGPKYAHLEHELLLITIGSCLASSFGALWFMNASRGWVRHAWLYIPGTLLTQALLSFCLDLSTVHGVLLFGIFSQVPVLALNAFLSWNGFRALRRPRSQA